uniref:FHA domain-containing protein n=1 Tax=Globisporangium ultimum (strain ATCC 200006 / CBS 805.95 / DAOM BR144) TaxID=431595 RepID=K3WI14_GLOUD
MAPFKPPKWAATPSRANRFAKLDVIKNGEVIEKVALGQQACIVLGRREDVCDYELQHPSISRQHAALIHDKHEQINVLDLGSSQGTFVNDREIEPEKPVVLEVGDIIRFGASTRTYVFKNEDASADKHNKDEQGNPTEVVDDALMKQLPMSFGTTQKRSEAPSDNAAAARKKREAEIAAMTAQMMAAPAKIHEDEQPTEPEVDSKDEGNARNDAAEEDDDEDDDDDDGGAKDDVAARYNIPISHEVNLESHVKTISCIAVDPPGGRIATGSMDYHAKLWDFAGMARHVRPFRDIEVDEGHPVLAMSYSPSGDRLLVATGSSQPKVLSREGVEELQFAQGDMYVMDMTNTNGHTHAVTGGAWHPKLRDQMITSSLDGTVRIWHLGGKQTFKKLINTTVLKFKSKRGRRCGVTTCRFNLDGTLVAGGTMDGQIQCYDPRKAYAGASLTVREAHAEGGGDLSISCIRFSPDGRLFASRSCADDTVKVWDMRKTNLPVKVFSGMEGVFGTSNLAFNAQGTCIVAGTSVRRGQEQSGKVHFLDVHTPGNVAPLASVDMKQDESAVCVEWHHGINQVFVGGSTGAVRVLYNPTLSTKGVLLSATKKLKVQSNDSGARIDGLGKVHNPHSLPMYRDEESRKRKFHKIRSDPIKSKAPDRPITGPGMGGKISGSTTFTQYFMSNHIKTSFREEDPREAILKYAKKAEEAPQFVARVEGKVDERYALAKETLEQEKISREEEEKRLLLH